jgi:hypothetical protein
VQLNFPGCSERQSWTNPGLSLRWACSLGAMERLAALPAAAVEQLAAAWVGHVRGLLQGCAPQLACLRETGEDGGAAGAAMPGGVCSIISFVLYKPNWCVSISHLCLTAYCMVLLTISAIFYLRFNECFFGCFDDSYGQIKPFSFEETKELYIEMTQGSGNNLLFGNVLQLHRWLFRSLTD